VSRRNRAPAALGTLLPDLNAGRTIASAADLVPASDAPAAKPIAGPGRPDRYKLADGSVVPSVTTVTGRFKDSTALLAWANREGLAGRNINEKRDAAADDGHIVHQWIQDDVHGKPLTAYPFADDETLARATRALDAFRRWRDEVGLFVLATEVPLVSERYRFGGTLDSIAVVQGVVCLVDWKSGGGCYPEHVIQQAAYRLLLRERAATEDDHPPLPDGAVLLRLDKDTGEPHATVLPPEALDLGERAFLLERELYGVAADVAKLVKRPKPRAA
jgi:hypothetical protein